jgi:two-component system chemotaxis response regulator CheB
MALHVGLLVEAEFLRLVLRQLLRRMAGVELIGEAATPAEALTLSCPGATSVDVIIAEAAACVADPPDFAILSRRYPGRIVLLGNGSAIAHPGLIIRPDVVEVPMGTATAARDLSLLASRLEAALVPLAAQFRRDAPPRQSPEPFVPLSPVSQPTGRVRRPQLVLIAASTGGPEALQELFATLRPPPCPIVVALHIPAEHTAGLVRHLAAVTGHHVTVGQAGALPDSGIVLLQGGMNHLVVARDHGLCLRRAPAATSVFHPNWDILPASGAPLDRPVVGVVLTGMGNDGCAGAIALAARGHPILAQSPGSCAVAGMPAAAIAAGVVREVAIPATIGERLNVWFGLPDPA